MNAVLKHYPSPIPDLTWHPLGCAGGFSGASVWRGDLHGKPLVALKAWPIGFRRSKLRQIHEWMLQSGRCDNLHFVPRVWPWETGQTIVYEAGRLWDVCTWMGGTADFSAHPNDEKLRASCRAIAQLHRAWTVPNSTVSICPAVERRLSLLGQFDPNAPLLSAAYPEAAAILESVRSTIRRLVPLAMAVLEPERTRPGPVQPCLCDVWHDHVLFDADRVTGIVDYGSMKFDHPAVDLARWLGDVVGDEESKVRLGLDAYREAGGPWEPDFEFVSLLDRTGVICAGIHWMNRLSVPSDSLDRVRLVERVRKVAGRLETISRQSTRLVAIPRTAEIESTLRSLWNRSPKIDRFSEPERR